MLMKMADAALGIVTDTVLRMVLSLAAEEITLAWGMEKELRKVAEKLEMIEALLSGAQSKQITHPAIQLWLKKLRFTALDAQIVLDEFGYEILLQKIKGRKRDKVRAFFSSSNPLSFRSEMAHKIAGVLSSLEQVYAEADQIGLRPVESINSLPDLKSIRSTFPFVEDSKIVGREDDVSKVISMLLSTEYKEELPVITIQGMGGQGKTTLAQLIYKNHSVKSQFNETMWICVSDDFNVRRILAQMLESLTGSSHPQSNVETLVKGLKDKLKDKRYLLVLDDVWNDKGEEWDRMRTCLLEIGDKKESKILVTARDQIVASAMRSKFHQLQILSEDQSWLLFEKCAFAEGGVSRTPRLEEIGKGIIKRCGGVPLAIKVIGGLLYSKESESDWAMIEKSDIWSAFDAGDRVLSTIKLSYDHLPSLVKQCFASCAIFEKDTKLVKERLIELWMAQGLLNPPKGSGLQMEDVGCSYLNLLLRSSLLQGAYESYDGTYYFKMHDLVHDVSLRVSKNYCYLMKDLKQIGSNEIEAVHISINLGDREMPSSWKGILPSKMRTLHVEGFVMLEDLIVNVRCLTVLKLESGEIKELPNSIGNMKHLRCLDIWQTNIKRLPTSITRLYYLQTLRVANLDDLPKGFHELINLRHFYIEGIDIYGVPKFSLPHVSKLTNLETLPFFKVTNCSGCKIEELEHMDNLKGTLIIFGLENIRSYESAAKSNLSRKTNITTLMLCWDLDRNRDCDDTDVMEGLKPHLNLEHLEINGYQSPKFPSWMMRENDSFLLTNLVSLQLFKLEKCERLPSLGSLPCLKSLFLYSLHNVKCIGEEFYGCQNLDWAIKSSSCSDGPDTITLFPALEVFYVRNMNSLVEWWDATGDTLTAHSSSPPSVVEVKAFPCLKSMIMEDLPELRVFPNLGSLPSLIHLDVIRCKNLTYSCSPQVLEGGEQRHLSNVQQYLPSLSELCIVKSDKFTAPFCGLSNSFIELEQLTIECNPQFWPRDLHHLTRLRHLSLFAVGDCEELDCFPWPYSTVFNDTTQSLSLTSLALDGLGLPAVRSLPDQIQFVTTLSILRIWNFNGLEVLPEWLGKLRNLEYLRIDTCKNLKHFPSVEACQHLTNLRSLKIWSCPVLKERCAQGNGAEWPKIAHIPEVDLE